MKTWIGRVAIVTGTAAFLVSCSSSPAAKPQAISPAAVNQAALTPAAARPTGGGVAIGKSVEYAGYQITLRDAQVNAADGTVTVTARFHNSEGDAHDPSESISSVSLVAGGQSHPGSLHTRTTPGGDATDGTIEFDSVTMPVSLAGAKVTFGDNLVQQAIVPFDNSSPLVDLTPVAVPVGGQQLSASGLTVSFKTANVSAEVPGEHVQAHTDTWVLFVGFSLSVAPTVDTSCLSCLHGFDPGRDLRLRAADGSTITAGVNGSAGKGTQGGDLFGLEPGVTHTGDFLRFTIPATPGTYDLVLTPTNLDPSTAAPSTTITVPAFKTAASA